VAVVFRGGMYTPAISAQTAHYFALYSIALFAWSAQAIYSRAFYASGTTWLPMLSGTVVMVTAIPLYWIGYRMYGTGGLALATDIGIVLQTVALAVLLHQRRMVSLADIDYRELGRCIVAGTIGGAAVWAAILGVNRVLATHPRSVDLCLLVLGSLLWTAVAGFLLDRMGSALPKAMIKRIGIK
jgi:putative peptidoglycan lipid II flippase